MFSYIPEGRSDVERMMDRIIKMQAAYPKLVIKVLITDLLPTSPLKRKSKADLSMYVPNYVDGERNGVGTQFLRGDIRRRVQTKSKIAKDISSEESDDDDW
jgi:hypothetical protein